MCSQIRVEKFNIEINVRVLAIVRLLINQLENLNILDKDNFLQTGALSSIIMPLMQVGLDRLRAAWNEVHSVTYPALAACSAHSAVLSPRSTRWPRRRGSRARVANPAIALATGRTQGRASLRQLALMRLLPGPRSLIINPLFCFRTEQLGVTGFTSSQFSSKHALLLSCLCSVTTPAHGRRSFPATTTALPLPIPLGWLTECLPLIVHR